jgi:hypothetical protein
MARVERNLRLLMYSHPYICGKISVGEKIQENEVKKTVRNAVRNVKEAVEPVVEETQRMVRRASLQIVIHSAMGGAITTDEIAEKIPEDAEAVYVKVEENMLYWVRGEETGGVNIW